ncbi:L,D-transpeptidase family protein [Martelella limonii]|uniref:L,D-transpeptidase family protein n=1 Tax=Martelella limonii TaxID=1647649 RepID=UPI00158033EE|nr:murein L,D-transpeptidase family protein [Martelella limonii]
MRLTVLAPMIFATMALTGCNSFFDSTDFSTVQEKMNYSLPSTMVAKMSKRNMSKNAPITIRIFKEEGVLEIWKQTRNGTYGELETYEICAWSGKLGPKKKEGDRQAPEGFYPLSKGLLNPYSQYFLAINTGFPNRYDRANQFTGSDLMIHGACSSRGCYSMTDEQILEIFALARDAFAGGQQAIMLQAYPFRMTADNMARHRYNENYPFWQMLKEGYDYFDVTHKVPDVDVCGGSYVFNKDPVNGGDVASDRECPVMASNIPTQDMMPLATNRTSYEKAFAEALEENDDKVWIDPTEAERKALVADLRKDPMDALYQPTGPSLEAGRYITIDEYRIAKYGPVEKPAEVPVEIDTATQTAAIPETPAAPAAPAAVPVPEPSPMAAYAEPEQPKKGDKPFWKFW